MKKLTGPWRLPSSRSMLPLELLPSGFCHTHTHTEEKEGQIWHLIQQIHVLCFFTPCPDMERHKIPARSTLQIHNENDISAWHGTLIANKNTFYVYYWVIKCNPTNASHVQSYKSHHKYCSQTICLFLLLKMTTIKHPLIKWIRLRYSTLTTSPWQFKMP